MDLNDVMNDDKPLASSTSNKSYYNSKKSPHNSTSNNNNNSNSSNRSSNKQFNDHKDQKNTTKKYNHTNNTKFNPNNYNYQKYTPNSTKHGSEGHQSYGKYVKMPYDPKNTYICPHTSEKRPKWELISSVLREQISSSSEFQEALLAYNPTYRGEWSFIGLHQFVNSMDTQGRSHFFSHTLPSIVDLALILPDLMNDIRLPVLLPGPLNQRVSLNQHQIASLLANAFLCTFPRRNKAPKVEKYYSYHSGKFEDGGVDHMPTINFNGLFGKSGKAIVNKLRCILNYFSRVTASQALDGIVDFDRRELSQFPDWDSVHATLQSLHIYSEGTIEDSDPKFLHVDFSNKYIGGGILGRGCVQEEIMFCIYPELIIARLFNAMLSDTECCIFTGAEKYSTYSGYSDSFLFVADFKDTTPSQQMDALNFKYTQDQYDQRPITRELNKCFCAFFNPPKSTSRPIATGNWGCGAFNGDLELKAVIQLMAAAVCQRTLHYFTFENSLFANNLASIHDFLANDTITGNFMMHYESSVLKERDEKKSRR